MTRKERKVRHASYLARVADRGDLETYLTLSYLWRMLATREYQAAMACTLRLNPDRFDALCRMPVPLRLVEDVHSMRVPA